MPISDIIIVLRWYGALFLIGAAASPFAGRLFASWHDRGYLFSKAIGLAVVTWIVFVLGTIKLVPFGVSAIWIGVGVVFVLGFLPRSPRLPGSLRWKTIVGEELFFLAALLFWSFIKAHEPSIRGLEKFMDYGFMQSIVRSQYFPPVDMWYPPHSINYYYFGHMVTAVLTKLSGLDLGVGFNLMLSSIFALCLTMSFSIGRQLVRGLKGMGVIGEIGGGLLTSFLVTLSGNMQTVYAFTKGYTGENVQPFWNLWWGGREFFSRFSEGLNIYWYANATRFIPYTIHEFPSYSFVVSDVHGHVLSIPFALLAIALLLQKNVPYLFYGFLAGVLLMTNALDGPIYAGLLVLAVWFVSRGSTVNWRDIGKKIGLMALAVLVTSLPFLSHFKSFVSGIAVNCPLPFLANTKIGPILFEGVEKCQRSPLWMMYLLWGFFWFCGAFFLFMHKKVTRIQSGTAHVERILLIFFVSSILLIIFPEFLYFKDIYPQHFRSNTMFKLGYQAFMLFSIVSGYAIMRGIQVKNRLFLLLLIPHLFLVSIYPLFSVNSYFGGLRQYEGLDGTTWLAREYPDDFAAITWLKQADRMNERITLVEADGDSYTDYDRFSVFTGIPTIIGWAVHEWLWRGTYDVVSPRREEVRIVFESEDDRQTREILDAYGVKYVVVGAIERQKFPALREEKFRLLGREVFRSGETVIYEVR